MTQTTTENEPSVAEVVEALLGVEDEASEASGLEAQMARVATEVDARTADSYCRLLLGYLADDPQGVRELEALMILGLAHPSVFETHRIPLGQEGRRLAHLLEQGGKTDRAAVLLEMIAARAPDDRQVDHDLASMLRRTGNADRLIDRYMRRAEDCVSGGRTKEAITWLQEILLVDRSRRDVARMIRDLRWGDQEKRIRWRSRVRGLSILLVLGAVVTLVVQRERQVSSRYDAVPMAVSGDLNSLRERLRELDRLQAENPFSLRLYEASRERARLKVEITQLEAQSAQIQIARRSEREAQLAIAESARKQGRIFAQQNRFRDALEQFERALADGPGDWDQRKQIETDVAAIREWIAVHGSQAPGDRPMSFVHRMLSGSRLRAMRRALAESPSPRTYAALAGEHARLGEMEDAERVAREGMEIFPGNAELGRLADRSRAIEAEGRTRELYRELRDAPRPAIWRELCEILLASGRIARAEECAQEWFNATGDGNAQLARGQARCERFFTDRRRDDAKLALELVEAAEKLLARDPRPLRLKLAVYSRVGAWTDARRTVGQLLEIEPGDAGLEARFRTLSTLTDRAPSLEQALRDVEKSGRLVDEENSAPDGPASAGEIRPVLKRMCTEPGVRGAVYVRGATALVQGPRGATAERTARAVREVVQKSRTAARRLGLGQAHEVTLEGDFGHLHVSPGDLCAAALWSARPPTARLRQELVELTALLGATPQDSDA